MLKCLLSAKALFFIGGVASTIVSRKAAESKVARGLCVKGLAKAMKLYDDAKAGLHSIREEAEDIYADAKNKMIADNEASKDA